jgi:hypothetical protein
MYPGWACGLNIPAPASLVMMSVTVWLLMDLYCLSFIHKLFMLQHIDFAALAVLYLY